MTPEFTQALRRETTGFISLSDEQLGSLEEHWVTLSHWNQRLNLTAVRSTSEAVRKHYAESLFLASCIRNLRLATILDIGSGAGFPGIPVAVAYPQSSVTLVESHQRKAVFLREATRSLTNVVVRACRVEELSQQADVAISRAVAWQEIYPYTLRVADAVALLASEGDAHAIVRSMGYEWEPPLPLPWTGAGVVLIGRR